MANQTTNYQCPACTGPLHFEAGTGRLECEYCGSVFSIDEIENFYKEKDAKASEAAQEADRDAAADASDEVWGEGLKQYQCTSCGAELICDENTAATACPYCGNPTIVPGKLSGMLKPDYIIPFRLDRESAKRALKNHYKGKFLLPKAFTRENHIEELKGIYVPFWLFDETVNASISMGASNSSSYRQGDKMIAQTDYYWTLREGYATFEKIPADGSGKMPDDLMDSIQPYDYGEMVPFSNAYLPGFLADKYDVSAEECEPRIRTMVEGTIRGEVEADLHRRYNQITSDAFFQVPRRELTKHYTLNLKTMVEDARNREGIRVTEQKVSYCLLPVWLLCTQWNGKTFLFAMNGQSGKMVGNLPMDKKKFWLLFLLIVAILELIMAIILL